MEIGWLIWPIFIYKLNITEHNMTNMASTVETSLIFKTKEDIEDFKQYIKSLIKNPQLACHKTQNILLLYIGVIQFVVLSFDLEQYLDEELIKNCNILAKTLYSFYKDINTLLYTKKIEQLWKEYIKINELVKDIPTKNFITKATVSRNKLLEELHRISCRIKNISN